MELRHTWLRYALLTALERYAGEVLTIRALIDDIEASGMSVPGRPSKTVSDALRWEVRRGRVERVGRGRYRLGRVAPSTMRRARSTTRRLAAGDIPVKGGPACTSPPYDGPPDTAWIVRLHARLRAANGLPPRPSPEQTREQLRRLGIDWPGRSTDRW